MKSERKEEKGRWNERVEEKMENVNRVVSIFSKFVTTDNVINQHGSILVTNSDRTIFYKFACARRRHTTTCVWSCAPSSCITLTFGFVVRCRPTLYLQCLMNMEKKSLFILLHHSHHHCLQRWVLVIGENGGEGGSGEKRRKKKLTKTHCRKSFMEMENGG